MRTCGAALKRYLSRYWHANIKYLDQLYRNICWATHLALFFTRIVIWSMESYDRRQWEKEKLICTINTFCTTYLMHITQKKKLYCTRKSKIQLRRLLTIFILKKTFSGKRNATSCCCCFFPSLLNLFFLSLAYFWWLGEIHQRSRSTGAWQCI